MTSIDNTADKTSDTELGAGAGPIVPPTTLRQYDAPPAPPPLRSSSLGKIFTLQDVKGPFEDEAETAIVKAMEKRHRQTQSLPSDEQYTYGSNVLMEAAHLFRQQDTNNAALTTAAGSNRELGTVTEDQPLTTMESTPVPGGAAAGAAIDDNKSRRVAFHEHKRSSIKDMADELRLLQLGARTDSARFLFTDQQETSSLPSPPQPEFNHHDGGAAVGGTATLHKGQEGRGRTFTSDSANSRRPPPLNASVGHKKNKPSMGGGGGGGGGGMTTAKHAPSGDADRLYHNVRRLYRQKGRWSVFETSLTDDEIDAMEAQHLVAGGGAGQKLDDITSRRHRIYEQPGGDEGPSERPQQEEQEQRTGCCATLLSAPFACLTYNYMIFTLLWNEFRTKLPHYWNIFKIVVCKLFLPLLGVAAILYYPADNPMTNKSGASVSWFLILAVRQIITLFLATVSEFVLVEVLSLRSRIVVQLLGPSLTLLVVQAKGWPAVLTFWALWDFAVLYGSHGFANHWLYWQDAIDMFNEKNPSGNVLDNDMYLRALMAMIFLGTVTAIKRTVVAVWLGKRSCEHYGPRLESILYKMLLMTKVAYFSHDVEEAAKGAEYKRSALLEATMPVHAFHFGRMDQLELSTTSMSEDNVGTFEENAPPESPTSSENMTKDAQTLITILETEKWTEPTVKRSSSKQASIHDILQYRLALSYMDDQYPFSPAFGRADTRESCLESAQRLYHRLLKYGPDDELLSFDTLTPVVRNRRGELNLEKYKQLRRLFRPEQNGKLSMIDFVRSCDDLYKKLRTLRAATSNAARLDRVFEKTINVAFYFVMFLIILAIMKVNPWALLVSFSAIIVSLAFIIGGAASEYFQGILLIIVRRPYDIGDRIGIFAAEGDTSPDSSYTWYVDDVTLFTTTIRFGFTNEVATLANGSLARSRIINGARSPNANVYLYLKFASNVPIEKINLFTASVDEFIKARPRIWKQFWGLVATQVNAQQGYIEYVVVLEHREAWQQAAQIWFDKAEVATFCLTCSQKLDIKYVAPPLPVRLGIEDMDTGGKAPVSDNPPLSRDDSAQRFKQAMQSPADKLHTIVDSLSTMKGAQADKE